MQKATDLAVRQPLRAFLARFCAVSDEAWLALQCALEVRFLPRRTFFVRSGDPARHAAFVVRGLLESCRIDERGREAIVRFCPECTLAAPYADLVAGRQHATAFIRALEDSSVLLIDYPRWCALMDEFPCFQRAGRVIAEQEFVERERRELDLMTASAQERLDRFRERHTALVPRLPKNRLAAYLGMNPVTLSRLLSRSVR